MPLEMGHGGQPCSLPHPLPVPGASFSGAHPGQPSSPLTPRASSTMSDIWIEGLGSSGLQVEDTIPGPSHLPAWRRSVQASLIITSKFFQPPPNSKAISSFWYLLKQLFTLDTVIGMNFLLLL